MDRTVYRVTDLRKDSVPDSLTWPEIHLIRNNSTPTAISHLIGYV
jgi:hypothetical protein